MNLDHLRQCARPMVFNTGIQGAAFSIAGTAFLVGFHHTLFVLTARHVVRGWPVHKLVVYPSDRSKNGLRLSDWWYVEDGENEPDSTDLFLVRAELTKVPKSIQRSSHLLNLTQPHVSDWFKDRHSAMFYTFGYPKVANEADYANSRINTQQFFLRGTYIGPSVAGGCHEILLKNPLELPDFDGLSGSPVFCVRNEIATPAQPTFCGMAIRGTSSSGRMHFLEASTILVALQEAINAQQPHALNQLQRASSASGGK